MEIEGRERERGAERGAERVGSVGVVLGGCAERVAARAESTRSCGGAGAESEMRNGRRNALSQNRPHRPLKP